MKEKFPHFPHSSKTTVKEWDSELHTPIWAGEQVHHISTEIGKYYPYCFYIDNDNGRIAFLNRAYKPIKKSCRGDKVEYWFKFDVKKFKNMQRLCYLESCMLEISPFTQRFALTIKRAYELKQENDELKRKLKIATQRNKFFFNRMRPRSNNKVVFLIFQLIIWRFKNKYVSLPQR